MSMRWVGIPLLSSVAALSSCTLPVKSDYDATLGVARCHTFSWIETPPATNADAFANPLNTQRLHAAVSNELSVRGIQLAGTAAAADCVVSAVSGSRPGVTGVNWSAGFGWGYRRWGGFGLSGEPLPYQESSVSVDLFDAHTHQPIWHASTAKDLSQETGNDADNAVTLTVRALFDHFPHTAS